MKKYSESELCQTFANNLAYLRRAKGRNLSQKSLARLLHLSEYAINTYELNRAAPSANAVYQVSVYFGIPMEKLLTKDLTKGNEPHARKL